MDKTPDPLKATIERWAKAERHEDAGSLPDAESLVAFRDRQLDPESRRELRRQLALQPDAAREYVDFVHFTELEPPTEDHRLTDQDVAAAFDAIRDKIMPSDSVSPEPTPHGTKSPDLASLDTELDSALDPRLQTASPRVAPNGRSDEPAVNDTAPAADPVYSVLRWQTSSSQRRYQQFAMAAAIAIALGAIWIGTLYQKLDHASAPKYTQVFDISVTRGGGPTSVAKQEGQLLLLIHDADLEEYSRGELEITDREGKVLFNQPLNAPTDASLPLSISVERASFPDGTYRIVLYGLDDARHRQVQRDYRWKLESEPTD